MNIFHLYQLPRWEGTRYDTFGYGTLAGVIFPPTPDTYHRAFGQYPPGSIREDYFELGMALCSHGGPGIHPTLYKSVEFGYTKHRRQGDRKAVIIERLYYPGKKGLIPYRLRYRYGHGPHIEYLYLQNLEKFHQGLTGNHGLNLRDPLIGYLEAVLEMGQLYYNSVLEQAFLAIQQHPLTQCFTHCRLVGHPVAKRLENVVNILDAPRGPFHMPPPLNAEMLDLPDILTEDLLTYRFPDGEVPIDYLNSLTRTGMVLGDNELPLNLSMDPTDGELLTTPYEFSDVAAALNELTVTDLDLEYILSQGHIGNPNVHKAIDRFLHLVPAGIDNFALCTNIAHKAFRCLHEYLRRRPGHPLYGMEDINLRMVKTFNDEALLTFCPHKRSGSTQPPSLKVHFDLALLSLCAPGGHFT